MAVFRNVEFSGKRQNQRSYTRVDNSNAVECYNDNVVLLAKSRPVRVVSSGPVLLYFSESEVRRLLGKFFWTRKLL
jgi:hypothetical protein